MVGGRSDRQRLSPGRTGPLVLVGQQARRPAGLPANLSWLRLGTLQRPVSQPALQRLNGVSGAKDSRERSPMPTIETLIAFFGVAVLLGLSPGPDNVFVLLQSAQRGARAGMAVVAGLCAGLVVHTAAVALGLAALFASSAMAFTALKYCGAAYLVYLAWQAWRAPVTLIAAPSERQPAAPMDAHALWRMAGRGMLMNLSNPKVLIFFLAFLPQFADPARGSLALQIMALGCVFMFAAFLVFGVIACCSGAFGQLLQRSGRGQHWLNRATALVFIGLAVRLASLQR